MPRDGTYPYTYTAGRVEYDVTVRRYVGEWWIEDFKVAAVDGRTPTEAEHAKWGAAFRVSFESDCHREIEANLIKVFDTRWVGR